MYLSMSTNDLCDGQYSQFCIVLLCICGCMFWLISVSSSGLCTIGLEKEVLYITTYGEVLRKWNFFCVCFSYI
jgi:hypothetical protein